MNIDKTLRACGDIVAVVTAGVTRRSPARRLRRSVGTALATVALIVGTGILVPAGAQAQVGWHAPAKVTCYDSGRILLEPRYEKVGNFDQYVGHLYQIYSYATGKWSNLGQWHWYHVPTNHAFVYTAVPFDYWRNVTPGSYYVYTNYAWSAGGRVIGQTGDYTLSYGFAQGDGVVAHPDRCYTYPAFTTAGHVNSDTCSIFGLCARAASSARPSKVPRGTKRQSKPLPPPPPPRVPRPVPTPR